MRHQRGNGGGPSRDGECTAGRNTAACGSARRATLHLGRPYDRRRADRTARTTASPPIPPPDSSAGSGRIDRSASWSGDAPVRRWRRTWAISDRVRGTRRDRRAWSIWPVSSSLDRRPVAASGAGKDGAAVMQSWRARVRSGERWMQQEVTGEQSKSKVPAGISCDGSPTPTTPNYTRTVLEVRLQL